MADKAGAGTTAGSMVPSLLGLATNIATAIPGLKKAKKRNTAQSMVSRGALRTGQAAIGASQTGFGASRGLALRSGLRAASDANRAALPALAQAANMDQARFDQAKDQRNQRLASFGKGLAGAGAAIGGQVAAHKAAQEEPVADVPPGQGSILDWGQASPAQAPVEGMQVSPAQAPVEAPDLQLDPGTQGDLQNRTLPTAQTQLQAPQIGRSSEDLREMYNASMGMPANPMLDMAPELEHQLRVQNIMLQQMQRDGVPAELLGGRLNRLIDSKPNFIQAAPEGLYPEGTTLGEVGGFDSPNSAGGGGGGLYPEGATLGDVGNYTSPNRGGQ